MSQNFNSGMAKCIDIPRAQKVSNLQEENKWEKDKFFFNVA
jgi:hypothetical protein